MKFEITDKREYKTTHWYVESENDTYNVICQEGDLEDEWFISSDEEGELDRYSEISKELIGMCSSDNSKPSDY
jgi:hypothetical protein